MPKNKELYEDIYKKGFSFGKNWKKFLKNINKEKIENAKQALSEFAGSKNISGSSFVDIGCGSGLSSLAAYLLGAKKVISVDIDNSSLWCTRYLKKKFAKNNNKWIIKKGSALDEKFIKSIGKHDFIYSWGVLHHTGNMKKAFSNIDLIIKKKGIFYLAIYNNNRRYLEGTSNLWSYLKRIYSKSGKIIRKIMEIIYVSYLIAGMTASGRNPYSYIKNYKSNRGMGFFTDIKDWLGGYPYEYATAEKIVSYFKKKKYSTIKIKKVRSIGCNEFLFKKE